jgi:hypothetical protein
MSEAKSGLRDLSRSVDELDLGPLMDHLRERLRIPVGEADAAVGFGLADALRLGGAVDAVAVAKIDPGVADGIVGTGIKAAIEKAVMQRGSYPLARQSMGLSVMLPPVNRML